MFNVKQFPWEVGVLILSIDPATKVSALAWRGQNKEGKIVCGSCQVEDILDSDKIEVKLRQIAGAFIYEKVWVAVEYPGWNAGASQTVRATANIYVRLVRRVFPKVEVVKVDPKVWQGHYDFKNRMPGQTTKEFSLWVCQNAYGWAVEGQHDRADAALILEWLRVNPPAPKPKTKKPTKKKKKT